MRRAVVVVLALACRSRAQPASRAVSVVRVVTSAPDAPPPPDACTGVDNAVGVRLRPGFCMKQVATGMLRPRQMALAPDGAVLVAESGAGWRHNRGRVSVLRPNADGSFASTVVAEGLDRPHGIAYRDGYVWVAEAGRIARFAWPTQGAAVLETVVASLPADGRHPHKTLGFAPDGTLFFSIGSGTDNCQARNSRDAQEPCPERDGPFDAHFVCNVTPGTADDPCPGQVVPPTMERSVVMRWDAARHRATVFSHGLRNNLGLAWHPGSGRLWGVENSRDYIDRADATLSDAALPHDELNELTDGSDHGWPYCYDDNVPSPEYRARGTRCRTRTAPALNLPAHAAPISIAFYDGAMFPAAYRSVAFITYHGYRASGHRVVTVPFGADGRPSGAPEDFISAWEERPGRPHGHLLGLLVARDGSLLVTDDVQGTVYQVRYGASALRTQPVAVAAPPAEDPAEVERRCAEVARRGDLLSVMQRTVIDTKCVSCHASSPGGLLLRRCDWRTTYESLAHGRSSVYGAYVVPGRVEEGVLMARLRGDTMGPRMPMQGVELSAEERAAVEQWVRAGAPSP